MCVCRAGGGGVPHRRHGEQQPGPMQAPPAPGDLHRRPEEAEPPVLPGVHRDSSMSQRQRLLRQELRVCAQDEASHLSDLFGESH